MCTCTQEDSKPTSYHGGSRYIYIDSRQQNRHYLVIEDMEVEVWRDLEKIVSILIEKQNRSRASPSKREGWHRAFTAVHVSYYPYF